MRSSPNPEFEANYSELTNRLSNPMCLVTTVFEASKPERMVYPTATCYVPQE